MTSSEDRQRAIDAAVGVLARSGLHGLKIETVIAHSGLSNRAFYRQFANKNDLLRVLIEQHYSEMATRSARIFATAPGPLEGVCAWIGWMISLGDGDERGVTAALLLYRTEVRMAYPDAVKAAVDGVVEVVADAVRAWRDDGRPWLRPRREAATIYLLTITVLQQRLMSETPMAASTAVDMVWPFVRRSLTWQPGSPR